MRPAICIAGKVPPLQGGVSRLTLETAHRLSEIGFDVHVVTNASETEDVFRHHWRDVDSTYYDSLRDSGIFIHNLHPLDERSHIPYSPCFETRMCGRICSVVERYNCKVIIGWYLQPYGVAAALAARFMNLRYILIHAGSDLAYLAEHPDLSVTYSKILSEAALIIHSPKKQVIDRLQRLGVRADQMRSCSGIPDLEYLVSMFEKAEPYTSVEQEAESLVKRLSAERSNYDIDFGLRDSLKHKSGPHILCAGKISHAKNYYSLFLALDRLAKDGIEFRVTQTLIGRRNDVKEHLAFLETLSDLRARISLIPAIPPWRLRGLMKQVDIGVYLESSFSMDFHTSGLPLEYLTAGTCLLISREGVAQGCLSELMQHGLNAAIVEDPSTSDELTATLRTLLTTPGQTAEMGRLGRLTLHLLAGKVRELRKGPLIYQIVREFVGEVDEVSCLTS